ncbi:MAG: YbhB/YbcL family Raf kinase inhibitor-like protein [Haloferacaceae archaeon]
MLARRRYLRLLVGGSVATAGCAGRSGGGGPSLTVAGDSDLSIGADAFDDGAAIPERYTCDGDGVNPALTVDGVPADAESLALVVDDPDAGDQPFVHWLLWGLPPDVGTVPRGVATTETVEALGGARQGTNSAGKIGYVGPCPPTGDGPHTYRFRLFALDADLQVAAGAKRGPLAEAINDHALADALLTGTYERE